MACSGLSQNKDTDLKSVVETFHHDIRWRYNRAAADSVDTRHAAAFLDLLDDMKEDLNVSEWEIRRVKLSPDGSEARIRVRIKYFKMPSTVVQDEVIDQVWRRKDERWFLVSQKGGPFDFPPRETPKSDPDETRHGPPP